jgi:hypothetical protein
MAPLYAACARAKETAMTDYVVKPLDANTWDAFAQLVQRHNGVFGGCWCTWFHTFHAEKTFTADHLHLRGQEAPARRSDGGRPSSCRESDCAGRRRVVEGYPHDTGGKGKRNCVIRKVVS